MEKIYYFVKLLPPRPSFMMDMNDDEKAIMQAHLAYWQVLMGKGIPVVYGPVFDPTGGYGMGVLGVANEEELKEIIQSDPANGLNRYEYAPMRAILPLLD